MLEINELGENGKVIQKGRGCAQKEVCCYEFGFSCSNRIIVMMNRIRESRVVCNVMQMLWFWHRIRLMSSLETATHASLMGRSSTGRQGARTFRVGGVLIVATGCSFQLEKLHVWFSARKADSDTVKGRDVASARRREAAPAGWTFIRRRPGLCCRQIWTAPVAPT